ncbi:MAG: PD-(D/E)XK motif protein [Enterocloster sp.]
MISIKELHSKWNNISPLTGGFLLVSGEHPLSFHIGYVNGENKCFIVLNTGKIDKIPSSKAICAENVQTVDGEFALRFILNYPSLDELFVKLCWDLIDSSLTAEKPVEKIVSQYKSWMRLLQQASEGILSSSMQKGLIGELLYLEEKIYEIGEEKAFKAWVGPEGSDQDFIFEYSWSEVKSTSISSDTVTISSVQQLERQEKGYLVVYFMDKISAKGQQTRTLPETAEKVKSLLSVQYHDELSCKLAKNGYFEKDIERYAAYMYRLAEKRIFLVDTDFPRLTRENIPVEVVNARYDLSLSAIDSHRI